MVASAPAIPLARWADRQLRLLAEATGSPRIATLNGALLTGERGSNGNYRINGRVSAGIGGSRINPTRDGRWFALTLLRPEDRALLPALFLGEPVDIVDNLDIARAIAGFDCADLLERGRALGLPVACADETPSAPPVEILTCGPHRQREPLHRPLVIDLSVIWAGPLAGHLLWLAGAEVVKVESLTRPDIIRQDDHATFDLINQGKASVIVDFSSEREKAQLIAMIRRADFVIESSRVRALKHLGIDAEALVREVPGLVWLSVTGHGASGEAAGWAGIGNDCGVAAGLSRALKAVTGEIGYVGDALPDPLTGIVAALEGWRAYQTGTACRLGFAMSAITARALAEERAFDSHTLEAELRAWGAALSQTFPKFARRALLAEVHALGTDSAEWIKPC